MRSTLAMLLDGIALVRKAPRTAGELAELCDVTPKTARAWLEALLAEGLVEESAGLDTVRPGPRPTQYRWVELANLNAMCGYCRRQRLDAGPADAAHAP